MTDLFELAVVHQDEKDTQSARIAELEREKVRLESEAMYGAAGFQAATERIAELESMVRKLVRQHLPVKELEGMPGWSEVQDAKALESRVAGLEQELSQCRADAADVWGLAQSRAGTVDQLRAELEACRKDAGYWRYIRDRLGEPNDHDVHAAFHAWCWAEGPLEDVEAAIDAAMQEGGV